MSLKQGWVILVLACAGTAPAQISSYLGPGILTRGAGDIGAHAGEQVDLRLYGSVSAFVDNGLVPFKTNPDGSIPNFKNLYGVEARLTAYGVHRFKRAQLGLDYTGTYRYYTDNTGYNGSDNALNLGYTWQQSRRFIIDMRGTAGVFSYANNGYYGYSTETFSPTNGGILFDNRSVMVQGSMDFTYMLSQRTYFQAGGYGFKIDRLAKALIGVNGYALRGSINHRASQKTTYGVKFDHSHFDYPRAFGESDINSYQLFFVRTLGRYWTIDLSAGVYQLEVQGLQSVTLDPAVVAILGVSSGTQAFYRKNTLPSAQLGLQRRFKTAILTFTYGRTIIPGNGLYLTSRQDQASVTLSYTGIRRWSFSASGAYGKIYSIGQDIPPYRSVSGGAGATYALTRAISLVARFDSRQQQIDYVNGFNRVSYRATLGVAFSPGDVPISLW
jgi:hypothetical protein